MSRECIDLVTDNYTVYISNIMCSDTESEVLKNYSNTFTIFA